MEKEIYIVVEGFGLFDDYDPTISYVGFDFEKAKELQKKVKEETNNYIYHCNIEVWQNEKLIKKIDWDGVELDEDDNVIN